MDYLWKPLVAMQEFHLRKPVTELFCRDPLRFANSFFTLRQLSEVSTEAVHLQVLRGF